MTENEAIEELKFNNEKCLEQCEGACSSRENTDCACQDAVIERMLYELLQYREIGTVEECREAVDRQKPKKPVKDKYHHNCCSNCGWIVSGEGGYGEEFCPHCENCGQAIQWDENFEGMEDENT